MRSPALLQGKNSASQILHPWPIVGPRHLSCPPKIRSMSHEERPLCPDPACAVAICAVAIGQSGRRDLLQLPAGMGGLGLHAQGHQGRPQIRHSARQQELRTGAGADSRREGQSGRRHRLFRRHLRHEGQGAGRARALQARELGSGAGRPEGSGRLLDHDPLRHARPVRQQGRAGRQAGAGLLEGSAQARIQGHGRLSRSDLGGGRLCRRGRGQSRRSAARPRTSIPPSTSSRTCTRTIRSCRSRRPTRASCRARCRSCSTTTSMPIAQNIPRRAISNSSSPAKARWCFPMSSAS